MQSSSAKVLLPPTGPCPLPAQNHLKTQDLPLKPTFLLCFPSLASLQPHGLSCHSWSAGSGFPHQGLSAWDSLAAVALCLGSLSSLQTPACCKPPLPLALHTCARLSFSFACSSLWFVFTVCVPHRNVSSRGAGIFFLFSYTPSTKNSAWYTADAQELFVEGLEK